MIPCPNGEAVLNESDRLSVLYVQRKRTEEQIPSGALCDLAIRLDLIDLLSLHDTHTISRQSPNLPSGFLLYTDQDRNRIPCRSP